MKKYLNYKNLIVVGVEIVILILLYFVAKFYITTVLILFILFAIGDFLFVIQKDIRKTGLMMLFALSTNLFTYFGSKAIFHENDVDTVTSKVVYYTKKNGFADVSVKSSDYRETFADFVKDTYYPFYSSDYNTKQYSFISSFSTDEYVACEYSFEGVNISTDVLISYSNDSFEQINNNFKYYFNLENVSKFENVQRTTIITESIAKKMCKISEGSSEAFESLIGKEINCSSTYCGESSVKLTIVDVIKDDSLGIFSDYYKNGFVYTLMEPSLYYFGNKTIQFRLSYISVTTSGYFDIINQYCEKSEKYTLCYNDELSALISSTTNSIVLDVCISIFGLLASIALYIFFIKKMINYELSLTYILCNAFLITFFAEIVFGVIGNIFYSLLNEFSIIFSLVPFVAIVSISFFIKRKSQEKEADEWFF